MKMTLLHGRLAARLRTPCTDPKFCTVFTYEKTSRRGAVHVVLCLQASSTDVRAFETLSMAGGVVIKNRLNWTLCGPAEAETSRTKGCHGREGVRISSGES